MHASPCLTRYRVNPNERWCWCGRNLTNVVSSVQQSGVTESVGELMNCIQKSSSEFRCQVAVWNWMVATHFIWTEPVLLPRVACQYSSRDADQEDIEATAHVAEMLLHWNRRKGKSFETNVRSSDPLVLCLWQCCVLIICHLWPGSLV